MVRFRHNIGHFHSNGHFDHDQKHNANFFEMGVDWVMFKKRYLKVAVKIGIDRLRVVLGLFGRILRRGGYDPNYE